MFQIETRNFLDHSRYLNVIGKNKKCEKMSVYTKIFRYDVTANFIK